MSDDIGRLAGVKAALVQKHGIVAQRLTTGGYGEGVPRETNDTPEGRAQPARGADAAVIIGYRSYL